MPERIPSGKAITMLPRVRHSVPTMAGRIPPAVMPSRGIPVRNSQLMTPMPLTMMKPSIQKSTPTTAILINRKSQNAACSESFLRRMPDVCWGMVMA